MAVLLLGFPAGNLSPKQVESVAETVPEMELLVSNDREEIACRLDEIEIATGYFPRDLLGTAPQLKWYQQWGGAGTDWLSRYPEIIEKDFVLTNAAGAHAVPISEHIFGMLLMFARKLHTSRDHQKEKTWKSFEADELFELAGKTMLLIGVGGIGRRVARLAGIFEMRVIGIRRHPDIPAPGVEMMYAPEQLSEVLPQADVVVLTAPLTPDTRHLLGEIEFRLMKRSAILINTGRGGTIDEPVLIRALQEGWIAGAGLDVFETEPLPQDSPLWGMENVILTAHYSGWNPNFDERAFDIFIDNLKLYAEGKPLFNVVNKQLGY